MNDVEPLKSLHCSITKMIVSVLTSLFNVLCRHRQLKNLVSFNNHAGRPKPDVNSVDVTKSNWQDAICAYAWG